MRPVYLEFCGVNSFSEKASVDFTRLLEYGLFGVFGDTGSGKSTILDCISFALYGTVSRARVGSISEIINYGSDKAYVVYEFEIVFEGRRRIFRVERELKRKNAAQFAKVYEREAGTLLTVADGVRECNERLEKIIGLEQKDFEKCIALPQGEFAQFVKAQRADRLKLVSRLFGLEEYGERLVKKANAACARLAGERDVLLGKLEAYADLSPEKLSALEEEIEGLSAAEETEKAALGGLRAEEKRLSELLKKRREAETLAKKLAALEAQKGEIALLEREIGRIDGARAAVNAEKERAAAERALAEAERSLQEARAESAASEEAEKRLATFDEEGADAEINGLVERMHRAERAEEDEKNAAKLEGQLQKARLAYAAEAEKFKDFSYEAEKEKIEARLKGLGSETFAEYVKEHGKEGLFCAEYAVFAEELGGIYQKFPETAEEILPLIEKYQGLSAGKAMDFEELRQRFEAREKQRRAEEEGLLLLEKQNGLYRAHRERLLQLQTEGGRIKEELAALCLPERKESLTRAELERTIAQKRREKKDALALCESARARSARAMAALSGASEKANAARENAGRAAARLEEALKAGDFASAEEAERLFYRFGQVDAKEKVRLFREEYAAVFARAEELKKEDLSQADEEKVRSLEEELSCAEKHYGETLKALALKRDERERSEKALEKKKELQRELSRAEKQASIAERLKKLLEGNKFMEFAAEEYLVNVAENGSRRLLQLTGGRYFLRYEKGFLVGDNLAGGQLRGVYTLSGGETFLVSLSLALALSAEICAKSLRPIEFFFLDEGFGTLDGRLVDVVMDSLEKLKGEHFSIGVISHVEELKHRIARKLMVEKATENHGSRIRCE